MLKPHCPSSVAIGVSQPIAKKKKRKKAGRGGHKMVLAYQAAMLMNAYVPSYSVPGPLLGKYRLSHPIHFISLTKKDKHCEAEATD